MIDMVNVWRSKKQSNGCRDFIASEPRASIQSFTHSFIHILFLMEMFLIRIGRFNLLELSDDRRLNGYEKWPKGFRRIINFVHCTHMSHVFVLHQSEHTILSIILKAFNAWLLMKKRLSLFEISKYAYKIHDSVRF